MTIRAVFVGVNKHLDPAIPELSGARSNRMGWFKERACWPAEQGHGSKPLRTPVSFYVPLHKRTLIVVPHRTDDRLDAKLQVAFGHDFLNGAVRHLIGDGKPFREGCFEGSELCLKAGDFLALRWRKVGTLPAGELFGVDRHEFQAVGKESHEALAV